MARVSVLKRFLRKKLRRYFFAGLLVLVPVGLTIVVVRWIVSLMDGLLVRMLPLRWQPEQLFGFAVPGLGVVLTFLLIIFTGVLATNYFGHKLVRASEKLVYRIPLVKGIYTLFKQVADTVLSSDRQGFRKVVLIEYPRKGLWSIGFVTGVSEGELQRITARRVINVFIPTTPNPTSGYYILVPEEDTCVLGMTVEEAFKLIVSGGMVSPPDRYKGVPVAGAAASSFPSEDGR
ncbi:membrane protein of unknown function DUF502 [Syntrophotalea carbinolica DSM 2380]|uniref:DUF502 domain-containing protein n=1 Tax=Syntrophotalea carbinolica (strain DSM 2380 / NBRC 103641 / GraBd1) TaxID=338963 RepID=Q3A3J0_SYNC1|nr:DUF502 domain-containing protein [Syntrophotalea carbinolica]ABA89067.1 membrane protein of unknown function DUF502 [Syntrophotalea carbinolica DSM 2380]